MSQTLPETHANAGDLSNHVKARRTRMVTSTDLETASQKASRLAKSAETRAAHRARRQASTIRVGPYTVSHVDQHNWAIDRQGHETWYYPTLIDACLSLLKHVAGDHARRDLQGVLQAVRLAEERIVRAIAASGGDPQNLG